MLIKVYEANKLIEEVKLRNTKIKDGEYEMWKVDGTHINIWHNPNDGKEMLIRKAFKKLSKENK